MKITELHNQPVKPDTYEASMALNQIMKIGKHAIKLHKLIDDRAEMEAWVQKKIDLAGDYVKKVHGYMQGEGAGLYSEKAPPGREHQVKALKKKFGKSGAYALAWAQHNKHGKPKKEAAGVGIVTKQNTTPDVNARTLNKMLKNLHLVK